jgi:hypothetical protein
MENGNLPVTKAELQTALQAAEDRITENHPRRAD